MSNPSPMYQTLNPVGEAMETILRTMHEAEEGGQHTPGAWTKEGALHHLEHACDHIETIYAMLFGYKRLPLEFLGDELWGEIEHALTRLSMALWSHKRGDDGDHGCEGAEAG